MALVLPECFNALSRADQLQQIYEALFGVASGGSGAPVDATYITQTPNVTLTNEQALSGLASGLLFVTTGTGVLSTAVAGTDYAGLSSTNIFSGDNRFNGQIQDNGGASGTFGEVLSTTGGGVDWAVPVARNFLSQNNSVTVGASSSETTLFSGGRLAINVDWFKEGFAIEILIRGIYSTKAVGPGNLTFRIVVDDGSTDFILSEGQITALVGGVTNLPFEFRATIVIRTNGTPGVIFTAGKIDYNITASTIQSEAMPGTLENTMGTQTSFSMEVTVEWAVADVDNTITATQVYVTPLNI